MRGIRKYIQVVRERSAIHNILIVVSGLLVSLIGILFVQPVFLMGTTWKIIYGVFPVISVAVFFLPAKNPFDSVYWFYDLVIAAGYVCFVALSLDNEIHNIRIQKITPDAGVFLIKWIIIWFLPVIIVLLVFQLISTHQNGENKVYLYITDTALLFSPYIPGLHKNRGTKVRKGRYVMLSSVMIVITFLLLGCTVFLHNKYPHMDIETIVFTIAFAKGAASREVMMSIIIFAAGTILISAYLAFSVYKHSKTEWTDHVSPNKSGTYSACTSYMGKKHYLVPPFIMVMVSLALLFAQIDLKGYIKSILHETTLYEDYYIDPRSVSLEFPEKKKNLIYIYLESIENTYTSIDNGGNQTYDYIPELVDLALNNINFSNTEGLGGQSVFFTRANFTMGSTVAQTSGVPLIVYDTNVKFDTYLPYLYRLEDVLHNAGYNQLFIRGEDTSFANYDKYVGRYDDSIVFDHKTAKEKQWIPEDYNVGWGFEDLKLFEFAKKLILESSKDDKPFCATLFTADTHGMENGQVCELCDPDIKNTFAAAVRCTSLKVSLFLQWLEEQDFYKDTVIIIVGDHLVDSYQDGLRFEEGGYCRTTYNCIINSDRTPYRTTMRSFTPMDMFPTTLSAIGVKIEGDRLGIGTDLFSERETLCEELGKERFLEEVQSHSSWYYEKFWGFDM